MTPAPIRILSTLAAGLLCVSTAAAPPGEPVDFNREIRPLLAGNCFACHGPDDAQRKAGLHLDTREGALAELRKGRRAVVPGRPLESELVRRITAEDPSDRMPPQKTEKKLSPEQIVLFTRWVAEGARYARHWAYVRPARPSLPEVRDRSWPRNPIDSFILTRLEREGLKPSPEADRWALIRRLSLDLIGLPPTPEEADRFVADTAPDAYERLVDRLLARPAYGEHWARMWLDLARYADSAGYADDPPRTIWGYRDYVIDSFNQDKPFDQFTLEQIAGDLLEKPTDEQLVATGFHRNTQTNNEGGTSDEEFRNVAVVDRVNTTMQVWMGTTMGCAQCHNHKYDPITQEQYFQFFAFFNNTEDADRTDETPVLPIYTEEEKRRRAELEAEAARLEAALRTPSPQLSASQARWEETLGPELRWEVLKPAHLESREGAAMTRAEDGSIAVARGGKTDIYQVVLPLAGGKLAALRLEALPDPSLPGGGPGHGGGNFVVTRLLAEVAPPGAEPPRGRYVRVELPGKDRILSLAEVEVFGRSENLARRGEASQSSTDHNGPARLAIDGNTDGRFEEAKSTTHTASSVDPWWEVDLKAEHPLDRLAIWNRTDGGTHTRLGGFRLAVLDQSRRTAWERVVAEPPNPKVEFSLIGARSLPLSSAYADYSQPEFEPASVLLKKSPPGRGWAVGGETGKPHTLLVFPEAPVEIGSGSSLIVTIEQLAPEAHHTLGRFRLSASGDTRAAELARVPPAVLALIRKSPAERSEKEMGEVQRFFLENVASELEAERRRLSSARKELAELKPVTTVPIQRELAQGHRRRTQIQHRGNFLDVGKEVSEGVPSVLHPLPEGLPKNRLALARWLVDPENPLTARVVVNRYWEKLFGIGIVATSEEFGTQGELPSHPELLDWLATEHLAGKWRLKPLLRLIVCSASYRQSSRVTPELLERDPDNRLLARGPRVRLPAESIRDQALFAAGLLSAKMHGPPVRPPQPSSGVNAAFGGGIDWQTSEGEDRYRRALYTNWRRSNPYPSMATFDAPNREVCTVRRARTNTPLQALVTLNDPVYVEASQGLARRMARAGATLSEKLSQGFRLVLARPPHGEELERLLKLFEDARKRLAAEPDRGQKLATVPLGPAPEGVDPAELAALTVVGNVLLNLDETLMKR
jgi:hypothetical protein